MQAKAEKAREANVLQCSPTRNRSPRCVCRPLQRQKAAQAKEQAKLVELEAAAKAAVEFDSTATRIGTLC